MKYTEKLFETNDFEEQENRVIKFKFSNKYKRMAYVFRFKNEDLLYWNERTIGYLGSVSLHKLYSVMHHFLDKYNNGRYMFVLDIEEYDFQDKNVYMFFDLLSYHIIKYAKFHFLIQMKKRKEVLVSTNGFFNTCMYKFCAEHTKFSYKECKERFIKNYERSLVANESWYRGYITSEEITVRNQISQVLSGVIKFLKEAHISEHIQDSVRRVVSELVSNMEHNDGDCVLDIDICDNNINISFINIFGKRIFDDLMVLHAEQNLRLSINEKLNQALDFHERYFDEKYTKEDFYFVATFQENVTTKPGYTAGTGLTEVVKALTKSFSKIASYVITGNNVISFRENLLGDGSEVVGFNESNNFLNDIPDKTTIQRCELYIPGVVFHLIFKYKEEELC